MNPPSSVRVTLPPPDAQELSEYRSYLAANPDDSEVRRDYAMRLYQSRNVRGACAQYKQLIKANPEDARSRSQLAFYLKEAGSVRESEPHFKYLIRRNPRTGDEELDKGIVAEAYWNLHQIEAGRGNKSLSCRYRAKAVEYAPHWMIQVYGMLDLKPGEKE
jgi:tetratricopeptide (TPR) repeat protein